MIFYMFPVLCDTQFFNELSTIIVLTFKIRVLETFWIVLLNHIQLHTPTGPQLQSLKKIECSFDENIKNNSDSYTYRRNIMQV